MKTADLCPHCGKIPYPSKPHALGAAAVAGERGINLRPYLSWDCGRVWHLTSKRVRQSEPAMAEARSA